MKVTKVHSRGDFLNKPFHHENATIFTEVKIEDDSRWGWSAICKISDCNRTVSLCFDNDSKDDHINNLYKIDTLISNLREFRKGLVRGNREFLKVKQKQKNDKSSK